MTRLSLAVGVVVVSAMGCSTSGGGGVRRDAGNVGGDGSLPGVVCTGGTAHTVCYLNQAVECGADDTRGAVTDCAAMGRTCAPDLGCVACQPNRYACDGDRVQRCNAQGSAFEDTDTVCDSENGEQCNPFTGTCVDACDAAEASESYIGCEYWAVTTSNSSLSPEFAAAVAISNPQTSAARVTVTGPPGSAATRTIAPGHLETIELPWIEALRSPYTPVDSDGDGAIDRRDYNSVLSGNGAYHVESSLPVTVYQFNPLEYRLDEDCADEPGGMTEDGEGFSFTNDASLLLPVHVLTGDYIAMARPPRVIRSHVTVTVVQDLIGALGEAGDVVQDDESFQTAPGFVTIVGASDEVVDVRVTSSAHTAPSSVVGTTLAPQTPGSTETSRLGAGDVLQLVNGDPPRSCTPIRTDSDSVCLSIDPLSGAATGEVDCNDALSFIVVRLDQTRDYCRVGAEYDLTGTRIEATGPVMVVGGHDCAFVPADRFACDHLEEVIFPLETWGDDFIFSASQPLRGEPNFARVVSGADGNAITFDPPSVHAPVTLARGEMIEFETSEDFRVQGSGALLLGQFLVGQNYADEEPSLEENGDPSFSLGIPTEQFRTDYAFLAPSTYEQSWVNVTAPANATIMLSSNGGAATEVTGWRTVGGSQMRTARVMIPGGTHTMTGTHPFGIVVYGFGAYTSYMYPGGLDLNEINPLL